MEWNFYPKDNLNYQKRPSHFETASFCLPDFSPQAQKYSSKSLFSLATQYKYTTFEKR